MELILLTLTTIFVGYSAVAPEYRNNSLYTFNIAKDGSIIVMNTQTGQMHRCDQQFKCSDGLVLVPTVAKSKTIEDSQQ